MSVVHVYPVDEPHLTCDLDCWCSPKYSAPCPECEGANPDCWRCDGGWLPCSREAAGWHDALIVIHNLGLLSDVRCVLFEAT